MKLTKIIFAIGFALSFSFAPISTANALVQNVSLLCLNTRTFSVSWPEANGKCSAVKDIQAVKPTAVPTNFKAVCVAYLPANQDFGILNAVDRAGKTTCSTYEADPNKYEDVKLVNKSSISGKDPYVVSGGSQTGTTPATSVKNTTGGQTVTGNNTKPKTPAGTSTTGSGDCPSGFTSKGPLCVPENPFGDSDGIAGKSTIGELATQIISILLSISGIIAVVMVIYGGYLFMTARGNEEQAKSGRKTLVNALIGLVIVVVSFAVVQALTNFLTNK